MRAAGRDWNPFRLCGVAGFAASVVVALGVTAARDESLAAEVALIATAVGVFFALALAARSFGRRDL